jgi:hypothetical protein
MIHHNPGGRSHVCHSHISSEHMTSRDHIVIHMSVASPLAPPMHGPDSADSQACRTRASTTSALPIFGFVKLLSEA